VVTELPDADDPLVLISDKRRIMRSETALKIAPQIVSSIN
jgi:hypothetical protein